MTCGVYQIVNIQNGMRYIGSSFNIELRWRKHQSQLRLGNHPNQFLSNVYNKYTLQIFRFEILEVLPDDITDIALRIREQAHLDKMPSDMTYNLCPVAGSTKGRVHSEEAKRKISKSLMGHQGSRHSLGKIPSIETREKIRTALLGRNVGKQFPERHIAVVQIDRDTGAVLNEFESVSAAGKFLNKKSQHISSVCSGNRKTAFGFKWQYK